MEELIKKYFEGNNDVLKHLRTKISDRFIVISDNGYVGLFDKLYLEISIMTNAQHEKESVIELIKKAKGKVLIGGLGIGLVLLPLMNKPEVESIDVVELHQEIIDLVGSQLRLNNKVNIINDNIYTFEPKQNYDTIFIDTIDARLCTEKESFDRGKIKEDKDLVVRYKNYLNDSGYCDYFRMVS